MQNIVAESAHDFGLCTSIDGRPEHLHAAHATPRLAERQRHLQHPKSQRGTLGAEFKDSVEQKRAEVLRELVAAHL